MARPRFVVQHFVACPLIEVARAEPGNPYTLRDVSYEYAATADPTGGLRFEVMYLFARFFGRPGTYPLELDFLWVDSPGGPSSAIGVPLLLPPARIAAGQSVLSRSYRLTNLPIPGPGRYTFRLSLIRPGSRNRRIASEHILVRDAP